MNTLFQVLQQTASSVVAPGYGAGGKGSRTLLVTLTAPPRFPPWPGCRRCWSVSVHRTASHEVQMLERTVHSTQKPTNAERNKNCRVGLGFNRVAQRTLKRPGSFPCKGYSTLILEHADGFAAHVPWIIIVGHLRYVPLSQRQRRRTSLVPSWGLAAAGAHGRP
jgi:hypothetical protein